MDNSGKLLGAQINREWFLYQEKEVFGEYRQKRLTIGLPNETERRENRVCLTPEAVAMMVDMGHTIMIQRGAGEAAHYHDREYADAGAQMLDTWRGSVHGGYYTETDSGDAGRRGDDA